MLDQEAHAYLKELIGQLGRGAESCASAQAPIATLLFILSSAEFLSLYYAGSRRPVGAQGTRAFHRFLSRYFPAFNKEARNAQGHPVRVRIPLLRKGGKAFKRLRLSAALVHLFHRGVVGDLVAPPGAASGCITMSSGRWGFQINVNAFHRDFQETLRAYTQDVLSDQRLAQAFLRRYLHLHGWTFG